MAKPAKPLATAKAACVRVAFFFVGGGGPACSNAKRCSAAKDCTSGICTAGACAAASCDDGARNGIESDVDCGGSCNNACDNDRGCLSDKDCKSNKCSSGVCAPLAASCDDKTKNSSETDV